MSGSDSYKFDSLNGMVNIPASTTAGAIDNHATLTVYVDDDEKFGGIIVFLPREESEPFPFKRSISTSGVINDNALYHCTDFIDVRLAKTVIYQGVVTNSRTAKVFGYDDKKNPVRILLRYNEDSSIPVPIDFEGVSYIVACSKGGTYGLTVYYKDRRRR